MESLPLHQLPYSPRELSILKKGRFVCVVDLLLSSPAELAKRCTVSTSKAKDIYRTLERSYPTEFQSLEDVHERGTETITTGDDELDSAIGGGIRTGMIWEVAGESAAGKTQFALQMSMLVQLPSERGGLNGSACYLTTKSELQTGRLMSIAEAHPRIVEGACHGDHVQAIQTFNIPKLLAVLSTLLPAHIEATRSEGHPVKPVKLLIIDALGELFHLSPKTSTNSLVERARNVAEICALLHHLASKYQIAVLVLNEVVDVFDRSYGADQGERGELLYRNQSPFFSTANSIPGENKKEVALGIVCANQVNVRILFSRTNRRRYMDASSNKMQKIDLHTPNASTQTQGADEPVLIRRLTVIFSSVSLPTSRDYLVTAQGIVVLPSDTISSPAVEMTSLPSPVPEEAESVDESQVALVEGDTSIEGELGQVESVEQGPGQQEEEDEWQDYWKLQEGDDLLFPDAQEEEQQQQSDNPSIASATPDTTPPSLSSPP